MVDVTVACSGGDDAESVSEEERVRDCALEDAYDRFGCCFAENVDEWMVGDCPDVKLAVLFQREHP